MKSALFKYIVVVAFVVASEAFPMSLLGAETISNSRFAVTWDDVRYAVQAVGQARPFATGTNLNGVVGKAKVTATSDSNFGPGQEMEILFDDGSSETFQVFDRLPFVLCKATLANSSGETKILNRVPLLKADLDLGQPPTNLVTLGTGGLEPPDKILAVMRGWRWPNRNRAVVL